MSTPSKGMRFVHKAILREVRAMERDAAAVSTAADAADLAERFALFRQRLHFHAKGEEEELFPALEERAPNLSVHYVHDHRAEEELVERFASLLDQARDADDPASLRPGLLRAAAALAHHTALHVGKEDAILTPAFDAHFTPPEQGEVVGRMMRHFPPEVLMPMLPWILQAIEPAEQEVFVGNLQRGMPAPVFDKARAAIQAGLPEAMWEDLKGRVAALQA